MKTTLGSFSQEQLKKLGPIFAAVGIDLPTDIANRPPEVYISDVIRDMSFAMGDLLRGAGLYIQNGILVTIDEATGKTEEMKPEEFVTWTANHFVTFSLDKYGRRKNKSISETQAKLILKDKAFTCKLPVLRGVHRVKLPVLSVEGELKLVRMRLLHPGYDPETGIFTCLGGVDYAEDMRVDQAVTYLREVFRHFPFEDKGRSFAAHLSAMLTMFCQAMLPLGARPPMFIYNANKSGAGKSLLVKVLLTIIFGKAGAVAWNPDDKTELRKLFDSYAQHNRPYIFFDDGKGKISSTLLNQWVTTSTHEGRKMGGNEIFEAELRAVTFLTGTGMRLEDDIGRRSIRIELFPRQSSVKRKLPSGVEKMSEQWAARDEVRGKMLAALYALVRNFYDPDGWRMPGWEENLIDSPLDFTEWEKLVPPILVASGFVNPLTLPEGMNTGDVDRKEKELVIETLIREELVAKDLKFATVRLSQVASVCRRLGAFVFKLGTTDDMLRELEDRGNKPWPKIEVQVEGWFREGNNAENPLEHTSELVRKEPETDAERRICAQQYLSLGQSQALGWWLRGNQGDMPEVDGHVYEFGSSEHKERGSSFPVRLVG